MKTRPLEPMKINSNLVLAEELHILLLDRQQGGLICTTDRNMRYAFAGAVLMDLAKISESTPT